MSVSQRLAAALVDLEVEDVAVVTIDPQDHGMKAAIPCGPNPCACTCPCVCNK